MDGLQLLAIKNNEEFRVLVENQFIYCRHCGFGIQGFLIAVGVGYIDSMIFAQNTERNNYTFIYTL